MYTYSLSIHTSARFILDTSMPAYINSEGQADQNHPRLFSEQKLFITYSFLSFETKRNTISRLLEQTNDTVQEVHPRPPEHNAWHRHVHNALLGPLGLLLLYGRRQGPLETRSAGEDHQQVSYSYEYSYCYSLHMHSTAYDCTAASTSQYSNTPYLSPAPVDTPKLKLQYCNCDALHSYCTP